jgi:cation diffusion facilitator family transporter
MTEDRTPAAKPEREHSTIAVIAALLANLGIAAAKFIGFLITGASSMLAEAFHSVADSGNQAMLLLGSRVARREPDRKHPFGHGRVRYFAAFLVAVVLFTLGSLFSLYEGYDKLRHPHELESPAVALAILVVALVLEGRRCARRSGRPAPSGAGRAGGRSSAPPSSPSSRWCCWRTRPPSSA